MSPSLNSPSPERPPCQWWSVLSFHYLQDVAASRHRSHSCWASEPDERRSASSAVSSSFGYWSFVPSYQSIFLSCTVSVLEFVEGPCGCITTVDFKLGWLMLLFQKACSSIAGIAELSSICIQSRYRGSPMLQMLMELDSPWCVFKSSSERWQWTANIGWRWSRSQWAYRGGVLLSRRLLFMVCSITSFVGFRGLQGT